MPNAIEMDEGDAVEEEDDVAFDVVQSHKWYCYWVYAGLDSSQKEGWRTLFERLTSTSGNKPKEANEPTEIQKGSSISKIGVKTLNNFLLNLILHCSAPKKCLSC